MQTDDANRFRDLLRGMGRVFGNEPDAVILDAYWLALQSWELDEFEQACGHLLATSKFMPRPADFTELRKAARMTAGEAFARARVLAAGCWERDLASLTSGDARLDAAVRAVGGYRAIAVSTHENIGFLERRFFEHFESISEAEDIREALPQLAGPSLLSIADQRMIAEMLERP